MTPRCIAERADGQRCKGWQIAGSEFCRHHSEDPNVKIAPFEPEPEPVPEPALDQAPALLAENRQVQGSRLTYGHRSLSMLRPICDICQAGANVSWNWYLSCTHEPYVSVVTEEWKQPSYEDEVIDGSPTGAKILVGTVTKTRPIAQPNWAEASITTRINNGEGVARARRKGFIRPTELRTALFPNGIAECCEWSDCRWQIGLKEYREGRFCREQEARLAAWDVRRVPGDKKALEIGWNDESEEKRREQLNSVVLI